MNSRFIHRFLALILCTVFSFGFSIARAQEKDDNIRGEILREVIKLQRNSPEILKTTVAKYGSSQSQEMRPVEQTDGSIKIQKVTVETVLLQMRVDEVIRSQSGAKIDEIIFVEYAHIPSDKYHYPVMKAMQKHTSYLKYDPDKKRYYPAAAFASFMPEKKEEKQENK